MPLLGMRKNARDKRAGARRRTGLICHYASRMHPLSSFTHRLPEVYQWLIASGDAKALHPHLAPAALAIENFGAHLHPLASGLRRHLSEYDAEDNSWLALDAAVLAVMRDDLACLRLLGESATSAGALPPLELLFARRGHVILEGPGMLAVTAGEENTFRVALAHASSNPPCHYHLAADPTRFRPECLTAVIGDAFAEWMSSRIGRGPA
jgi:hypothetical protein